MEQLRSQQVPGVVVVGGGQAGLAAGYYLRRAQLPFVILDQQSEPGGAWQQGWASLRLFSPAQYSSLPGWPMPTAGDGFPTRDQVVQYLTRYEQRYDLPICRPVRVSAIRRVEDLLFVDSSVGTWPARAVVSATGTRSQPFVPAWPDRRRFRGPQLHTVSYRSPQPFRGQRVLVVGGGNSGAQILAEVARVAKTIWVTRSPPCFLPDDVDGRVLFEMATRRLQGRSDAGEEADGLNKIVMVPPVKEARERGVLKARPPFAHFAPDGVVWPDGSRSDVDAVIWCTGFRPALTSLRPLSLRRHRGRVAVDGTRSRQEPRLWLLGYGDWTGPASATLIGVGRTARSTVDQIADALAGG